MPAVNCERLTKSNHFISSLANSTSCFMIVRLPACCANTDALLASSSPFASRLVRKASIAVMLTRSAPAFFMSFSIAARGRNVFCMV